MFFLRRTAARAISSTPSKAVFVKPRLITTITPASWRSKQQQWIVSSFQKRFASDEPAKTETSQAIPEASESFAQTAAEAPVDEDLAPAQQAAQSEPNSTSVAPGIEALEATANAAAAPKKPSSRIRTGPAEPNKTLYVGNLYYEVTADQLNRVFSRFGKIENARIIFDNRGISRGFGYVTFENINDAQSAIDNLDMQVFEGRSLVVQFHRAKPNFKAGGPGGKIEPNPPSKTLFIGNMSFEMSDKDLNDLFRDIRNVIDVRVAIDRRTGQPRGFAHADFIDVASATRARDVLKEKIIYGRQLRVDFSTSGTQQQQRDRSA